jgi:acyl-coenzyme A synthetase/AMP-(fatty) acid ligase
MASVRVMTFCGEALLPRHVAAIFNACRDDVFVQNTYGPTEATVSCTEVVLPRERWQEMAGGSIALGAPISGMEIHLVDNDEIAIAGPQLARGYWRDSDSTARAFVTRNIDGVAKQVYLTGDRGEYRGEHLYFVERLDHQVKIHGHRIELGDIDAALQSCGFAEACTVHVAGRLHAFVIAKREQIEDLRERLRSILPDYAIPSEIIPLDCMPLNANDKIDRAALAAMVAS